MIQNHDIIMFRAATRTSAAACDGRMVCTYTAAAAAAAAGFGRCPLVAFVHADAVLLRYESTAESVWKDFLVVAQGVPSASTPRTTTCG